MLHACAKPVLTNQYIDTLRHYPPQLGEGIADLVVSNRNDQVSPLAYVMDVTKDDGDAGFFCVLKHLLPLLLS